MASKIQHKCARSEFYLHNFLLKIVSLAIDVKMYLLPIFIDLAYSKHKETEKKNELSF